MKRLVNLEFLILLFCVMVWINTSLPSKAFTFEKESWEKQMVSQMRFFLSNLLWIRMKYLLSIEAAKGIPFEESQSIPALTKAIIVLNPHDEQAYILAINALWLHLKKKNLAYQLLLEGLAQNPKSATLQLAMANFQYYDKNNYNNAFRHYHLALRFSNRFSGMELSLAGEKNAVRKINSALSHKLLIKDELYIDFTKKQVLRIIRKLASQPFLFNP